MKIRGNLKYLKTSSIYKLEAGLMNSRSNDETYTKLISNLRENLNVLAQKIAPKVYEYEFLKE